MKKKIILILSLVIIVSLMLSSCNRKNENTEPLDSNMPIDVDNETETKGPTIELEEPADGDIISSTNSLEEAKEIYNRIVLNTFTQQVLAKSIKAQVSNDDGIFFTQIIEGNKTHILYSMEDEDFAFVRNEEYIYASSSETSKYYLIDQEKYDETYSSYITFINIFADLNEETDKVSFTLLATGEYVPGEEVKNAKLKISIEFVDSSKNNYTFIIENGYVKGYNAAYTDDSGTSYCTMIFEYGGFTVELPDLSTYFNASAPVTPSEWYVTGTINGVHYDEIPMYFDYLSGQYKTEYYNLIVGDSIEIKNKNDSSISFKEKIDDLFAGYNVISVDVKNGMIYFESEYIEE